jgi:hypothetical protein
MGTDPNSLTEQQWDLASPADQKKFKRGRTYKTEAMLKCATAIERKIHDQFIGFLRRHEIPYVHSSTVKKSSIQAGHPDFTILKPPWFFIEFKVKPNGLTADQKTRIAELEAAGNKVFVVDELDPENPGQAYNLATELVRDYYALPKGFE